MKKEEVEKAKEVISRIFKADGFFKMSLIDLIKILYENSLSNKTIEKAIEELRKEKKIKIFKFRKREFLEWRN